MSRRSWVQSPVWSLFCTLTFRELELMDKISRLKFEDYLPSIINGHLSSILLISRDYVVSESPHQDLSGDI